jgi:anti-anti-sigma factor
MKITTEINDMTCLMEIEGAIVGTHAEELNRLVHSISFKGSGINNLVLDLSRASMLDSIGIEIINHAQEKGLRVSILNPQGLTRDMLERARLNGKLSSFLRVVNKEVLEFSVA